MITPRVQVFIALALATAAGRTQALTLGELHGASRRGEPLRAYVDLYQGSGEVPSRLEVLPDLFDPESRAQAALLAGIEARVVSDGAGGAGIELRSVAPLLSHQISFRLRAETDGAASVKRYRLTFAEPAATVPAATRQRPASRAPALPTAVDAPPQAPAAGRYGPVKTGESLWTIARRLSGEANPQAMIRALHAANPHAFVGGDIDRLRAGAWLTVPGETAAADATAAALPPAPRAPAPAPEARPAPAPAPRAQTPIRGRDPVLAAELAALDAKFAAIRARYAAAGSPVLPTAGAAPGEVPAKVPAAAEPTPLQSEATAPAAEATGAPTAAAAPVATEVPTAEAPAVEFAAAAATPAPARAETDAVQPASSWASPLRLGLLGGALALGGLAAFCVQRQLARRRQLALRSEHVTLEAKRREEVARKAENRVRLESEVREILQKPEAAEEAPAVVTALSREDEIAAHIAHGRYAQAARQLQALLAEAPGDHAAKLRLAEVYYITEQVQEFGDVAADIKANHRSDLSDDEWQRLMRMGRIIAPDLPLFSGPQAVARRA